MKDQPLSELLQYLMDARVIVRSLPETERQVVLEQALLLATRKAYELRKKGTKLSFAARGYKTIRERLFRY